MCRMGLCGGLVVLADAQQEIVSLSPLKYCKACVVGLAEAVKYVFGHCVVVVVVEEWESGCGGG